MQNFTKNLIKKTTRGLFLFILFYLSFQKSFAQISGVKTVPGNYATLAAAITALDLFCSNDGQQ